MKECVLREGFSTNFVSTEKRDNLLSALHRREIGKTRKNTLPFVAKIPLKKISLQGPDVEFDQRFFEDNGSGFLGITHNGRYLVSIFRQACASKLFFFEFTPYQAILKRIITVETPNITLYNIEAYIPSKGEKYFGTFVYDLVKYRRITSKENNLPIKLYMSSTLYNFQISISNLIVIISRLVDSVPPKKSAKSYVIAHENGIILNTGISLINYMFLKEDVTLINQEHVKRVRKVWKILRKQNVHEVSLVGSVTLDLGEDLSISTTSEEVGEDYSYSLHEKNKELNKSEQDYLPIVFSRDYFAVEKWITQVIENHLRKSPTFTGSVFKLLYDFEVDIRNVNGFMVDVQSFALCELVVYKDYETNLNEFHLFSILFKWDLKNCKMSYNTAPHHIGKIDNGRAFGNRWWPLKTGSAVPTTAVHMNLNNAHLLRAEKRERAITTCDNHLIITPDD